jgi:hypothetical protein
MGTICYGSRLLGSSGPSGGASGERRETVLLPGMIPSYVLEGFELLRRRRRRVGFPPHKSGVAIGVSAKVQKDSVAVFSKEPREKFAQTMWSLAEGLDLPCLCS